MTPAEHASRLVIATRTAGAIATVLAVLIAGAGAGHLALSNMQALLGGFVADARDDDARAAGAQARGWEWRRAARRAARDDVGAAIAGDVRRRGIASHRWCRDRRDCVKAADAGTPRAYE